MATELPRYLNKLSPSAQVDAEEQIAATIFDYCCSQGADGIPSEEDCAELGRRLLLQVLAEFRPDLCTRQTFTK